MQQWQRQGFPGRHRPVRCADWRAGASFELPLPVQVTTRIAYCPASADLIVKAVVCPCTRPAQSTAAPKLRTQLPAGFELRLVRGGCLCRHPSNVGCTGMTRMCRLASSREKTKKWSTCTVRPWCRQLTMVLDEAFGAGIHWIVERETPDYDLTLPPQSAP